MKPFFSSLRLDEIHHLRNLLDSAGIRTVLRNEQLCTLAGEVPFVECAARIELLRESDHPAALEVLKAWREPPRNPLAWRCRRCGEQLEGQFTACWSCGGDRP
jgi:hypothetical protein